MCEIWNRGRLKLGVGLTNAVHKEAMGILVKLSGMDYDCPLVERLLHSSTRPGTLKISPEQDEVNISLKAPL